MGELVYMHNLQAGCDESIGSFFEALGLTNFVDYEELKSLKATRGRLSPHRLERMIRHRRSSKVYAEFCLYLENAQGLIEAPEYVDEDGTHYMFFGAFFKDGCFSIKTQVELPGVKIGIHTFTLPDLCNKIRILRRRHFSFKPRIVRSGGNFSGWF